jgi:hypothetical protein
MTMELGYSLTLHFIHLVFKLKSKFAFLVHGGMYPQVIKFSQICWNLSIYNKSLKWLWKKFISFTKYAKKHQVFIVYSICITHNQEQYGGWKSSTLLKLDCLSHM